jgi:hypothetical protein
LNLLPPEVGETTGGTVQGSNPASPIETASASAGAVLLIHKSRNGIGDKLFAVNTKPVGSLGDFRSMLRISSLEFVQGISDNYTAQQPGLN